MIPSSHEARRQRGDHPAAENTLSDGCDVDTAAGKDNRGPDCQLQILPKDPDTIW